MIREALSTDEADVQFMVDAYVKQFGGVKNRLDCFYKKMLDSLLEI